MKKPSRKLILPLNLMSQKRKPNKTKAAVKSIFQEWWEYSTLQDEDTFSQKAYKIFVRILGILLIIIFSPAIAIVLLFAMIAVV